MASRLIGLSCAIAAVRFVLALLVVPPWQNPDEPQHMLMIRTFATPAADARLVEREIVLSMYEHKWWHYYQVAPPSVVPETFADGPNRVAGHFGSPAGPGIYYRLVGLVVRGTSTADLIPQLFVARVMSAICGVLTVLIAAVSAQLLMGGIVGGLVGGLLALHPQFAIVATTASPDAFINLCGGLVFLSAIQAIRGRRPVLWVTVAWVVAVTAFLARRLGAPLLVMAGLASASAILRLVLGGRRSAVVAAALLVCGGLAALLASVVLGGTLASAYEAALPLLSKWAPQASAKPFLLGLFHSAWLAAGWLTLPAPSTWIGAVALVLLATGVFAVTGAVRLTGWTRFSAVVLPLSFIVVQGFAIYWGHYRNGLGPQGRYLFPVFVPFLVLMSHAARSNRLPRAVSLPVVLLVLAWLFDTSAWASVIVPGFLD